MIIDATFGVTVSFFIFVGVLIYFKIPQKVKEALEQKILNIKKTLEYKTVGVLSDKIFMFTGKLTGMSRAEAKSLIEKNSGTIVSNVSKKLDYLIIGEKPTKRKIEAAKDLKIKIIDQSGLNKLLDKSS